MEEIKSKSSVSIKSYHLKIKFNGKEFESHTDDLKKYMMTLKPFFLKTNVLFSCTNPEGKVCNKMIPVARMKMAWKNKVYMDMLINQLIFKNV